MLKLYQKPFHSNIRWSSKKSNISGALLGIGNPMLDYFIHIEESSFHNIQQKYGLRKNEPQLANIYQQKLFEFINSPTQKPIIIPGGSTQNSIKISQLMLQVPDATTFVGAVGDDNESKLLSSILSNHGVNVCYQVCKGLKTGKCLIFVSGKDRSLISDMGASIMLNEDYFENESIQERFNLAKYVYLEGFMWLINPTLMLKIMKKIQNNGKILATNLHAEFLSSYLIESEHNILENIDILFGNQYEALALAKAIASSARLKSVREKFSEFSNFPILSTDGLARLSLLLSQMSRKNNEFERIIIFTQGEKEIVMCHNGKNIHIIDVPFVPEKDIVDRTGCGDSFVGGFLSGLISGMKPLDAIQMGIFASQYILKQTGCSIINGTLPTIQ